MDKILTAIKSLYAYIIHCLEDALGLKRWSDEKEEDINMGSTNILNKCIDISKHQTNFNAAACKLAGVDTVLCRFAYGSSEDKLLNAHIGGVITGGLHPGGYGFATWHYESNSKSVAVARETMKLQVSKWIELAKKYNCTSWIGIDQELETGEKMILSKSDNTELLCEAAQMIESAGLHPCLYASASWIISNVDLNKFTWPLWVAYYKWYGKEIDFDTAPETFPANSGTYGKWMNQYKDRICMWQFTSEGYADKYGCTHGTNSVDKNWLYFQPGVITATNQPSSSLQYFSKYNGDSVSIVTALNSIGEQSSYAYRKTIAAVNGISGYSGTPEQNLSMVALIKSGKLIKP